MATYDSLHAAMQHTDEPTEVRKFLIYCIINNKIDDAKQYVTEYVEKYRDDDKAMHELKKALAGLPQEHASEINFERVNEINRYLLSIRCISGDRDAIHELGFLYEGIDGDEMRFHGINESNITTALTLYNFANTYSSCLEIIFICTNGNDKNHYFDKMYPRKCIDNMIKTNLIKAMKLYNKPIDNPNYQDEFGYIFEYIPMGILKEVDTEYPELAKYVAKAK